MYDVFALLIDGRCFYVHNDGALSFTRTPLTTVTLPIGSDCAVAGDFTSDGYPDVVVLAGADASEQAHLLRNPGETFVGTIFTVPTAPIHNDDFKSTDAADVNRDGNLDIVVDYYRNLPDMEIHLLRGDGNGGFTRDNPPPITSVPNSGGAPAVTVADFNQDRIADLIVGMDDDDDPGKTWFKQGVGDGTFAAGWPSAFDINPNDNSGNNGLGTGTCDAYDFDNDGLMDVVALAGGLPGKLFRGTGPFALSVGTTEVPTQPPGLRGRVAAPETFPIGVTRAGTSVATNLGPLATIGFDNVATAGVTRARLLEPLGPPEAGVTLAVLEIVTTATFSGEVSIAIPFGPYLGGIDPNRVRLYHDTGSGWNFVPVHLDPASHLLYGRVSSVSAFAITADTTATDAPLPDFPAATLQQNSPNPFNPSTQIRFTVTAPEHVLLRIFDARGRLVRTLLNETHHAGHATVSWDGRNDRGEMLPSGIYLYRLKLGSAEAAKKMVLVQ